MLNASTPGNSLGNIKQRIIYNRMLGISIAATAIFILGFVLAPTLGAEAHAAETVTTAVTWRTISLTIDPHGDIDFGEVIPSSRDTSVGNYGTQKVVKKAIDVTTEGDYYAVYLSTVSNDNTLSTSDDTIQAIPPVGGSSLTPSTFSQTSWGFSVPYIEGKSSSAFPAPAVLANYDSYLASTTDATANNLTKLGTGSSVYNTGSWLAVPTIADTTQIYRNSTNVATGFDSGDSFNIYYSVMVDTNTMAGTYENEVVYTAIASFSGGEVSYNVSRDKDIATSYPGEVETLRIDLATSPSSLTTSDIKIRLVPHSIFISNNYSVASLIETDYPSCTTTSVTSSGQSAVITCSMPAFGAKGSTDTAGTYAVVDGSTYDFWVKVTTPDENVLDYVSHYQDGVTDVASLIYHVGLQSKNTGGNLLITQMQQMSSSVCQNTTSYNSAASSTTTFPLIDTRDNNSYNIRKFGEDCWMVSNLLFIGNGVGNTTTLSPTTSDVVSSTNVAFYDLTSGNSYDEARIHTGVDNNNDATTWYNYAAATAGTITGTSNSDEAEHSVCPKNWKIPSNDQITKILAVANATSFVAVLGGHYREGAIYNGNTKYSHWWSSTASSTSMRWNILGNGNSSSVITIGRDGTDDDWRLQGFYLRCTAR